MNDYTVFRRIAAITAIISAPIALGASFVLLLAIDFDSEIIENSANILVLDPPITGSFRASQIVGLLGYALLVVPVTLYLWKWLMPKSSMLVNMYTLSGLGYIVTNVIAVAFMLGMFPPMMSAYPQASDTEREVMSVVFKAAWDVVDIGLFNIGNILASIWLVGMGSILRDERRILGLVAVIVGIGTFAFGVLDILQFKPAAVLEIFTFLIPIWTLWLGIVILGGAGQETLAESNYPTGRTSLASS